MKARPPMRPRGQRPGDANTYAVLGVLLSVVAAPLAFVISLVGLARARSLGGGLVAPAPGARPASRRHGDGSPGAKCAITSGSG
jgi:hypothetical protein